MFRTIAALILFSSVAAQAAPSSVNCTDSVGQVTYEVNYFSYGIPPRPNEPRISSESTWTFQHSNASITRKYDNGTTMTTGAPITAEFQESTKKVLENHPSTIPGGTSWTVYAIKLKFFAAFEPPFSTETFVICKEIKGPPSP